MGGCIGLCCAAALLLLQLRPGAAARFIVAAAAWLPLFRCSRSVCHAPYGPTLLLLSAAHLVPHAAPGAQASNEGSGCWSSTTNNGNQDDRIMVRQLDASICVQHPAVACCLASTAGLPLQGFRCRASAAGLPLQGFPKPRAQHHSTAWRALT